MTSHSALQLHPNVPSFYIIAASHELSHMSPAAARALLQRGLRLNRDSVDLWREYVRMELHFIEGMRRRWDVLGIASATDSDQPAEVNTVEDTIGGPIAVNEGEKPPDEVLVTQTEGDQGEAARRAIAEGAIVKSVMSSAAQGMSIHGRIPPRTFTEKVSSRTTNKPLYGTGNCSPLLPLSTSSARNPSGRTLFTPSADDTRRSQGNQDACNETSSRDEGRQGRWRR